MGGMEDTMSGIAKVVVGGVMDDMVRGEEEDKVIGSVGVVLGGVVGVDWACHHNHRGRVVGCVWRPCTPCWTPRWAFSPTSPSPSTSSCSSVVISRRTTRSGQHYPRYRGEGRQSLHVFIIILIIILMTNFIFIIILIKIFIISIINHHH